MEKMYIITYKKYLKEKINKIMIFMSNDRQDNNCIQSAYQLVVVTLQKHDMFKCRYFEV